MKRFFILIIYNYFLVSCSPGYLHYCAIKLDEKILQCRLSIENNEELLIDSVVFAIDFWKIHRVEFVIVDEYGIKTLISKIDQDKYGIFIDCNINLFCNEEIILSQELIKKSTTKDNVEIGGCVLAHELGHFLGMEHINNKNSLMSPSLSIDAENHSCFWSQEDQSQFNNLNLGI